MNSDGSNQTRLTNNPAHDDEPSFNARGSKIAFRTQRDGNFEIYLMNADGSNPIRLTYNAADDGSPSVSADSNKVAFHSLRDGNVEIYVRTSDGSNQTRLTNNPAIDFQPSFSGDGSKIAFTSTRNDGSFDIYVMNSDGSNQTRLTSTNGETNDNPSFSPDGSKIAFRTQRDGNNEIYAMNSDGSNQTRLTNNSVVDTDPSWGGQADSDGDGIGDACENTSQNRNRFFDFSDLLRRSNSFIEVDAGSNVPMSFSLNGFNEFDIYDTPLASQQISCSDKALLETLQPIQMFPGDPTYNSFDFYITTWRTQVAWAGTCRRLILTFNNGTTKTMDFQFR